MGEGRAGTGGGNHDDEAALWGGSEKLSIGYFEPIEESLNFIINSQDLRGAQVHVDSMLGVHLMRLSVTWASQYIKLYICG